MAGVDFVDYGGVSCSFDGVENPGTFLSTTEILCTSPSSTVSSSQAGQTRNVPLLVTTNGLHYGTDAGGQSETVTFEYIEVPVVSFLSPTTGPPSYGGAWGVSYAPDAPSVRYLRVHGAHFRDTVDLACRFEALLTVAKYISQSEVDCRIPPHSSATGDAPTVAVTLNGVDFSREGPPSATFTYVASPQLLGLSPALGPASGETYVTVLGSGFGNGVESIRQASLICRFTLEDLGPLGGGEDDLGEVLAWDVDADVESDTAATCVSPRVKNTIAAERSVYATVRVSADGGSSFSTTAARFFFYPEAVVSSLTPAMIPASEAGDILVSGEGFLMSAGLLLCVFTEKNGVNVSNAITGVENGASFTTPAVWLSLNLLQCQAPPSEVAPGKSTALQVRVTNNGVDSSASSGELLVYPPLEVSSLAPTAGPRAGGTVVNLLVDGWGLPINADFIYPVKCEWGSVVSTSGELLRPDTTGRAIVACASPPASAMPARRETEVDGDEVLVELLLNGRKTSTTAGLPFNFYNEPVVVDASPSAGREIGGTDVVITGNGFSFGAPGEAGSGKTVCMFGNVTVFAAVVSDSELRCRSPAFSGGSVPTTGFSVDLKVSLNEGVDFGSSYLLYHYLPIATTTGEKLGETRRISCPLGRDSSVV